MYIHLKNLIHLGPHVTTFQQVPAGRSVAIDRKENEEINVVDRGNCVYTSKKLNPLGPPCKDISTSLKK